MEVEDDALLPSLSSEDAKTMQSFLNDGNGMAYQIMQFPSSSYLRVLLMIDGKVRSLSALLAPYSEALSATCRKLDLREFSPKHSIATTRATLL